MTSVSAGARALRHRRIRCATCSRIIGTEGGNVMTMLEEPEPGHASTAGLAGGGPPSARDAAHLRMAVMSETIHNRIAMLRAERGISRRELADALGVHYQTIGYLERGEYSPSLHLAMRIAEYFEVPVEVIFSTTPFPRIGSGERSA